MSCKASKGCFQDGATRTLPVLRSNPAMNDTVESCSNWAKAGGYGYFGLQYYGQCFAGNGLPPTPLPETSCNTACTGNSGETCGGAWANSVFSTSNTY